MLFATVKKPLRIGGTYIVETEDVKKCKAMLVEIYKDFDIERSPYQTEYVYRFEKHNGFIFAITERTRDVVIEEVQG